MTWELNDDQTEITFFLEEGVKWHDGEEFTADDVVFTYQAMSDPDYVAAGGVRTILCRTTVRLRRIRSWRNG